MIHQPARSLRPGPLTAVPGHRGSGGGRRAHGFTLIEVLVATMLLASGLALAFATLRAATATVDRGEALAQRSERVRAVEQFLRRRLASAQAIGFAVDEQTGAQIRFVGEPDRVRFVADLPNYLGRGGPHLHDIAVLGGGDDGQLAASFSMVLAGETVEEDTPRPPEPLVRDLVDARFRYRGLDDEGALGEWQETWEYFDQLPLQVSIEIASADGGTWPPLVVALPQAASAQAAGPARFGGGPRGGMRGNVGAGGRGNFRDRIRDRNNGQRPPGNRVPPGRGPRGGGR